MKLLVTVTAIMLSGCSTMMCVGTGTCVDGDMRYDPTVKGSATTPSTVILPSGTYVIVPNYSTGGISAVIKTSRGK